MSKELKRRWGQLSAPNLRGDDRPPIQLLREEWVVAYFEQLGSIGEAYVKAPADAAVIHEFPMLCREAPTDDWTRTSINSFSLTRALQKKMYRLEDESDTPFSNDDM